MSETNVHEILGKQYRAAMAMLKEAITKCPESLWLAPEYPNKFWIRHIHHHTGQLIDRLRTVAGIGIGWVVAG